MCGDFPLMESSYSFWPLYYFSLDCSLTLTPSLNLEGLGTHPADLLHSDLPSALFPSWHKLSPAPFLASWNPNYPVSLWSCSSLCTLISDLPLRCLLFWWGQPPHYLIKRPRSNIPISPLMFSLLLEDCPLTLPFIEILPILRILVQTSLSSHFLSLSSPSFHKFQALLYARYCFGSRSMLWAKQTICPSQV